ncbi:hypothetical protein GH714_027483 [Hevea brasiliensis]|uniref:Glutathione S-transferase n=1 Tax=Hevea brasiliensis TaxID=3981 RepID=A0A6A6MHR5_HEVBR|nr:hypothetical protein GH714_027483 [Hevea brasiliensis]
MRPGKNPLLPENPYDRAIARFWAKFVDEKILQIAVKFRLAKEKEKEQIIQELGEQLQFLEKELEGKEFFGDAKMAHVTLFGMWASPFSHTIQLAIKQKVILPTALKAIAAEGKAQEQMIEEVHQKLMLLENELKGKDFFGGKTSG